MRKLSSDFHKGFTLVELLVVLVLSFLVLTFVSRVIVDMINADARLSEISEAERRDNVVSDLILKDFSNPLRLLSSSSLLQSGDFNAEFFPHSDFQTGAGYASRTSVTDPDPVVSKLYLEQGNARVSFVPDVSYSATIGWHTVGSPLLSDYQIITLSNRGRNYEFRIQDENGDENIGTVDATSFSNLEFNVEHLNSVGCRLAFYAVLPSSEKVLIARAERPCPAMPLELVADTAQDGSLRQITMSGSFSSRDSYESRINYAPLPYVGIAQVETPAFINPENNDLVLFRADSGTDKSFTQTDVSFAPLQNTTVRVSSPARGTYAAGNSVFIVDYSKKLSVVCLVTAVSRPEPDYYDLSLTPYYTPSDAAWGLFYSLPTDFAGKTLASGADVLFVSAPVQYRYYAAEKLVMRREGSGLWEAVIPGVSAFSATVSGSSLNIAVTVNTEGIETFNRQAGTARLSIPIR